MDQPTLPLTPHQRERQRQYAMRVLDWLQEQTSDRVITWRQADRYAQQFGVDYYGVAPFHPTDVSLASLALTIARIQCARRDRARR